MSGINAASTTKTHSASGADVATTGFLAREQITLSATPSGSGYAWSIALPSDSSPAAAALDDATDATPKFTPDVPGFYTISVLVDGATTYVLRVAVVAVGTARQCEAINFAPLLDSQVPTPA
ncbi:MAG TPA: hypothetical protein VFW03_23220, partial [Gemmatimonadaceae bacterium]|nr:hypothetical protein [Gemmatimonadaceae bacterium]